MFLSPCAGRGWAPCSGGVSGTVTQRWVRALSPALLYPCIMALSGSWDLLPLPGLLLGGLAGLLLPSGGTYTPRRGEVGVAQVRLELTASVLSQMQQLLLELSLPCLQ